MVILVDTDAGQQVLHASNPNGDRVLVEELGVDRFVRTGWEAIDVPGEPPTA